MAAASGAAARHVSDLHRTAPGGLGPLQSEAVCGTMTIVLKPVSGGTRILWEYVVGGYMLYKVAQIAPAIDKMLAEQLASLVAKLGPRGGEGASGPAPEAEKSADEETMAGGAAARPETPERVEPTR